MRKALQEKQMKSYLRGFPGNKQETLASARMSVYTGVSGLSVFVRLKLMTEGLG